MFKKISAGWVFAIGLILMFFLDGSISFVFSPELFNFPNSAVPCLTVLWLELTLIFADRKSLHLMFWAAVVGFIFDMYYMGLLGVFVFILPLVIYLSRIIYEALPANFLSGFLVYFIMITLVEGLSCFANVIVGTASVNMADFLVETLAPTLALNLVLFALIYFPVDGLYRAVSR